ncbi:MAG: YceD family protein [Methyloversatilis sp.]|jgi:uncharacterized protein|nr:YceD family protein [Methyloversatilis sp.]
MTEAAGAGKSTGKVSAGNESSGDEVCVRLDAQQLARAQQRLAGTVPLVSFERLAAECRSADGIEWSLAGSVDADGACWLSLEVSAGVVMQCQRCLGDVQVDVRSESRFRVVFAGEAWGDEDLDDDSFEALELDGPLDLAALVEDEVLLALPAVPLHEQCEAPAVAGASGQEANSAKPSPFAVLGQLKRN